MSIPDKTYRRNSSFVSAPIGPNEIVLFNPSEPDNYFGLKDTGLAIWNALAEPAKFDEIVSQLRVEYEDENHELEEETGAFLNQLLDNKIIEESP